MKNFIPSPTPIFDDIKNISFDEKQINSLDQDFKKTDLKFSLKFLLSYKGSIGTFNSYRREVERLIHWSWTVKNKSVIELKRENIEEYISFCQNPPKHWIGVKKAPRFLEGENKREPNKEWRPFVVHVKKSEFKLGKKPEILNFQISSDSIKEIFAILSSYYNFLIQEEYTSSNPVALIRQKSKFIVKNSINPIRRLSELQWQYVIETAEILASKDPKNHERTLFIMSSLYLMYLRISELSSSHRWSPLMNHFHKDVDGNWWFTTIGKGNKLRYVAVSDSMLESLKRWRNFLGYTNYPNSSDIYPLIPKLNGKGPVTSTTYLRRIVQFCFDKSIERLKQDGFCDESDSLMSATAHWLRHTGISDDVKIRPREHVRDDAGHSSSVTTDRYIDIEMKERHKSAKNKKIK